MPEESLKELIDRRLKDAVDAPLTEHEVEQLKKKIETIQDLDRRG